MRLLNWTLYDWTSSLPQFNEVCVVSDDGLYDLSLLCSVPGAALCSDSVRLECILWAFHMWYDVFVMWTLVEHDHKKMSAWKQMASMPHTYINSVDITTQCLQSYCIIFYQIVQYKVLDSVFSVIYQAIHHTWIKICFALCFCHHVTALMSSSFPVPYTPNQVWPVWLTDIYPNTPSQKV